jgi:hypothetical protein
VKKATQHMVQYVRSDVHQGVEKRDERRAGKAETGKKAAALTRWGVALRCRKRGQHLLPQSAGFASNVSQMRLTQSK